MKIKIVLMAVFCMILGASAINAQDKTTNFAGNWELDTAKSKMSERTRVESMTLNVAQTEKDLTVETKTKRAERPEGEMRGNGGGGAGRGGMMGGGGDMTSVYTLDGKETTVSGGGTGDAKFKAELKKDGKLKLVQTRSFETQMGAMSVKNTETWELQNEGKVLKVTRETETPRGTQTSEMYFNKQ